MLIIYIDRQTNRLGYTINFIFKELLGVDFMVTTSKETFIAEKGEKFSYCSAPIYDEMHLTPVPLLFNTDIANVETDYLNENGVSCLFATYHKDDILKFDVFAATFYMVSRYEEYLPFKPDKHLRFAATDSIAYQKKFLDKPVVNIWAQMLKEKFLERYPDMVFAKKSFTFLNTIDVDMAYYYKGKGLYRSLGGFCRDLLHRDFSSCVERVFVDLFRKKDPYDCFSYIRSVQSRYGLDTLLFYLLDFTSDYDKNISPYNMGFQLLIKDMSDYCGTGIHPSYYTIEEPGRLLSQILILRDITHKNVTDSRFHYLRFHLPDSYRNLIKNEITDDYSMGYPDCTGFRAGTCSSFKFYDLEKDCETKLRVHPFAFMDVALKNHPGSDIEHAIKTVFSLIDVVREVGGEFVSIWHNESLSDYKEWQGWRKVYESEVEYICNKKE